MKILNIAAAVAVICVAFLLNSHAGPVSQPAPESTPVYEFYVTGKIGAKGYLLNKRTGQIWIVKEEKGYINMYGPAAPTNMKPY